MDLEWANFDDKPKTTKAYNQTAKATGKKMIRIIKSSNRPLEI